MNLETAVAVIDNQVRDLKRVNKLSFIYHGYEYRLEYEGWMAACIGIRRRKVGSRNFRYYGVVRAVHCGTASDALKLVADYIYGREDKK